MWYLVFMLLRLFIGCWEICCLSLGNRCKWGEVGTFYLCALMSQGWSIRDQLWSGFVAGKVNLGTKKSENWESFFVSLLEILLKPVSFIVLRSAGEKKFSIEKNDFHAERSPLGGGGMIDRVFPLAMV